MSSKTLNTLLQSVQKQMFEEKFKAKSKLNSLIHLVESGDLDSKIKLKDNIKEILHDTLDNEDVNSLIEQYHVNYFEEIYTGDDNTTMASIVNKPVIKKNDDINKRLDTLVQIVFQELYGLSVIDPYSYGDIEGLDEIGTDRRDYIWFQIDGNKERIAKLFFEDEKTYINVVVKSASFKSNNDLKADNPELLCERISGARVTADMPPYSKYYSLNIRFFDPKFIDKDTIIKSGTSNEYVENFIDNTIPGRPNIFVIGDQGVGKTTYLLRLIDSIPDNLSLLTMESMFELNIDRYFPDKDVKALQFLNFKTPYDAFQTGLRQNRDIMIDGEVRSPAEADVTLQAMTRQSRGSMGSFHTTSCESFMLDYKNMLMKTGFYTREESALYDIARAVDILIFPCIDRSPGKKGKRYIKEIAEVILDASNTMKPYRLNVLFKYDKKTNTLNAVNRISSDFIERARQYEFTDDNMQQIENVYKHFGI